VAVGELQRKNVIADAGYSNGEQAEACEWKGILPHVPSNRATRHLHEAALPGMDQGAKSEVMRLRRSTVEHPFATLKYPIFGHPRFRVPRPYRSTNRDEPRGDGL
jgi:hypothetical protein